MIYHLQELEKVKNFDWEEWRKRFLKFHNNKKSRVTDLMRKASSIWSLLLILSTKIGHT